MRNHLIKVVLFFFVAYSSTAQAVLSLQDDKSTHFDNVNPEGTRKGGGTLILKEGAANYSGSLTDKHGQRMSYSNQFDFRSSAEGLVLSLRFYLNSFTYSSGLEVSYDGTWVVFPCIGIVKSQSNALIFKLK